MACAGETGSAPRPGTAGNGGSEGPHARIVNHSPAMPVG
jgi:hypothetical protein